MKDCPAAAASDQPPHDQSPLVVISAGHAAAAEATAELNLEAGEPKLQCLPSGRGTTAFTNDHDGVAIAAGDAAAAEAVAELNLES
jgi:hypothetical protein